MLHCCYTEILRTMGRILLAVTFKISHESEAELAHWVTHFIYTRAADELCTAYCFFFSILLVPISKRIAVLL